MPRREKVLMGILDPKFPLLPKDKEYKNLLVQTFAIMSEYPLMGDQVKMVQAISTYCRDHAYTIIKDAQYVFGNISSVNKTYLRNAQRERINLYIQKLTTYEDEKSGKIVPIIPSDKDLLSLAKFEELLMKLYNLPNHIDGNDDPEEKESLVIPSITFTSDPKALIEDAEFEDGEEE